MKKKTGKHTLGAGRPAVPESTPVVAVTPVDRIITIPRYERTRKKFGQNHVVQVGEETHKSKVAVTEADHGADVIDDLGRAIAICFKRKQVPDVASGLALCVVSGPATGRQLDDSTKLKWAKHPSDNWPATPETIVKSWRGKFAFVEEDVNAGRGGFPEWSRDGKEVFYRVQRKIMAVSVSVQEDTFRAQNPRLLFELKGDAYAGPFDVAADGDRFLFLRPAGEAKEKYKQPTVVVNWFEELQAMMGPGKE
jgi:hypothetical protein